MAVNTVTHHAFQEQHVYIIFEVSFATFIEVKSIKQSETELHKRVKMECFVDIRSSYLKQLRMRSKLNNLSENRRINLLH